MSGLRPWVVPRRWTQGRESLPVIRRAEIGLGLLVAAAVAVIWSGAWWSWLLLAVSLLVLSPWPILRRLRLFVARRPPPAPRRPGGMTAADRRALRVYLPAFVVVAAVAGYLLHGAAGAVSYFVPATAAATYLFRTYVRP